MVKATIRASFDEEIQKVWQIVTDLQDYSWRSDLSKIEVINEGQFIEYTTGGYPTKFTISDKKPFKSYAFAIENSNIRGHWQGEFTKAGSQTEIVFTEEVTVKKFYLKPFAKGYLKKQQEKYISDLTATLSKGKYMLKNPMGRV